MNATENQTTRSGAEWDAFLAKYRIRGIVEGGDGYDVESTSGHTYHVHSDVRVSRDDGGVSFTWHCTCPARKTCRHITAVVQLRWAEAAAVGDYDGMDVMEREEV